MFEKISEYYTYYLEKIFQKNEGEPEINEKSKISNEKVKIYKEVEIKNFPDHKETHWIENDITKTVAEGTNFKNNNE
jgi:hypothetical protein